MRNRSDEAAHPGHEESWYFDFVSDDGALAGYARLALHPVDRTAWWWTAVVGARRPYVLVREHEIALPRPGSLEIRAASLWAELFCEEPFEHWSVGLEAVAVALDDPLEAYRGERGEPTPLGLDLGWEAASAPVDDGPNAYRLDCAVHGEVLMGRERLPVDGYGVLRHGWGHARWDDDAEVDERGLIRVPEPLYHAPVKLPTGRLARALCRAPDGGRPAWRERLSGHETTQDVVS